MLCCVRACVGLIQYVVLWGRPVPALLACPGPLGLLRRGEEEDLDCVEELS